MQRAFSCLGSLSAICAALTCGAARAEPVRAVVEMYTSQSCASCPPADRYLGELGRESDVLVLTMPVSYWDYLGWKDSLAIPVFDDRQRAYAATQNGRAVFTPQAVINGQDALVGSDRAAIERSVTRLRSDSGPMVKIDCEERGDRIVVDVEADATGREAEIWLLPIIRKRPVAIGRGENKGRVVVYTNVVRGLQRIGSWKGQPVHLEVPRDLGRAGGADGYAVVLQNAAGARASRVLGAAKGPGL